MSLRPGNRRSKSSEHVSEAQYALRHYTEDGSWPEGPAYWHYGGQYLAMYIQGLNKSLGTDYGLSLAGIRGIGRISVSFARRRRGVQFYDGGVSYNMYESLWFASFFDKPEYAWFIGDLYERKGYFHLSIWCFMNPACSKRLRRSWIVSSPGLNRPPCEAPGTILMPCLLP